MQQAFNQQQSSGIVEQLVRLEKTLVAWEKNQDMEREFVEAAKCEGFSEQRTRGWIAEQRLAIASLRTRRR